MPVIVAGMHRSGTSMTASFMQALGVNIGEVLFAGDRNNVPGYFEDAQLVAFHQQLFKACCLPEPGWTEVGWTISEVLDEDRLQAFVPAAQALVDARMNKPVWGWKDPRTTVLLPFWQKLLPNARYVMVYRRPWEVVDSLYRYGHEVFKEHPEWAFQIWMFYNRRILEFYSQNRDKCVLVSTDGMLSHLDRFVSLLESKLGLTTTAASPEEALASIYDEKLLKRMAPDHPLVAATHENFPQAVALFDELDRLADIPSEQRRTLADQSAEATEVKAIAFYLPQFHPIPENDAWWGKGFTEWTNVARAVPQFEGHHQPHIPADLGFYDLRLAEIQKEQAALAKQYGIHGFCYYFYWFGGKRLLEKPLEILLNDKSIDMPFCLSYANENWTRRWDGLEKEVLIAQEHSPDDDVAFIRELFPYFRDERYIKVDGRPLLLIYRTGLFPNMRATAERWREECRKAGIGEIYLCRSEAFEDFTPPEALGFDAAYEMPPHNLAPLPSLHLTPTGPFRGLIHDYDHAALRFVGRKRPDYPLFRGVMVGWDNTARRLEAATIFVNSTPERYRRWLSFAVEDTRRFNKPSERIVFINAWNEWAEGAHLEPCKKYGHQYLEATSSGLGQASTTTSITAPAVSIVIPLYNKVEYTELCLQALIENTPETTFEVILVDNGSTDGTKALLQALEGDVRVITNATNLGFARACNQGARLARGRYVVLLNNDTVPQPGWLEAMLAEAEADDQVGVVGSLLLYPDDGSIQHAGVVFDGHGPVHRWCGKSPEAPEVNVAEDLDMVTGACMLLPKALWDDLGGLDEAYVNGFEDVDLCLRVRSRGLKVRYAPQSRLYHFESRSEGRHLYDDVNYARFIALWESSFGPDKRFTGPRAGTPEGMRWVGPMLALGTRARLAREAIQALDASGVPVRIDLGGADAGFIKAFARSDVERAKRWRDLAERKFDAAINVSCAAPLTEAGTDALLEMRSRYPLALAHVALAVGETDRLRAGWAGALNRMDEVWVPSTFNRETFVRAGVQAHKLQVVPGGIDTTRFGPHVAPLQLPERKGFHFLAVFEEPEREGLDILLTAYTQAFTATDDVALLLAGDATLRDRVDAFLRRQGLGAAPAITVVEDAGLEVWRPSLYASADAFVLPTRGDGWNVPLLEAMATGLPAIATRWGGHLDYMDDENSFLIDLEGLVEVPGDLELAEHRWAAPSLAHITQLMREVFAQPERARERGRKAREDVLARWDVRHTADRIADRVAALSAAQPRSERHDGLPVRWVGAQFNPQSLARVNREIGVRLATSGRFELELQNDGAQVVPDMLGDPRHQPLAALVGKRLSRPAAVHVRHMWPPEFLPPAEGAWVVMQPWEFCGLPDEWLAPLREQVDEYWVYTTWQKECAIASGVPADKIQVMPLGIDPELNHPGGERFPLETKKTFKFLFVGGPMQRKGPDVLLMAYARQFTLADDVCLVVKGVSAGGFYSDSNIPATVERMRELYPNMGEVEFIGDELTDAEMAALYRACDVLVHPYRGEGFGLPMAEAMASGLPVIATGYGSCLDFLDERSGYLVPFELQPVTGDDGLPPVGPHPYMWAEPDEIALSSLMRRAYEEPEERREKGRQAREAILNGFTWDQAAARVADRLDELAGRVPVRFGGQPPFPLEGRRGTAFLHLPDWREASWRPVLDSYLATFTAEDDVSLVLWLDPAQGVPLEEAGQALGAVLDAAGPGTADVLLVTDALPPEELSRLRAAVDVIVQPSDEAPQAGKPVLAELSAEGWRGALARPTMNA